MEANAGANFNYGYGNGDLFTKKLGPQHEPHDVQGHKMPDIAGNTKRIKENIPKKWHIVRGNAIRDALVAAGVPKESLTVTENVGGGAATGAVVVNWKD